jgi:hypothetical protein
MRSRWGADRCKANARVCVDIHGLWVDFVRPKDNRAAAARCLDLLLPVGDGGRDAAPCEKPVSLLSFPYVCPEPVLVKTSFLMYKWRSPT